MISIININKLKPILGISIISVLSLLLFNFDPVLGTYVLISVPFLILLLVCRRFTVLIFIYSLGFTEFLWIGVMGGYIRVYHILSVILLISFSFFYIHRIRKSLIFKLLLLFIASNILCIVLISPDKIDSLRSFLLPVLLISISVNIAVLLQTRQLNANLFIKSIMYITILVTMVGLLQIILYKFAGQLLVFSRSQVNQILLYSRPTSLFTEANTFGKFLAFCFLLLLPIIIDKGSYKQKVLLGVVLFTVVIVMTRSAWLMLLVGVVVYIFVFKRINLKKSLKAFALLSCVLLLVIMISERFGILDAIVERAQTLLEPKQTLMEDRSAIARIEQIKIAFEIMPEDAATFFLGNGWGTMLYHIARSASDIKGGFNVLPESSSNIFVSIFFFNGVVGLIIFLSIVSRVLYICVKFFKSTKEKNVYYYLSQGVFLAFIGIIVGGQIAYGFNAPQLWVVIGCAIFLECLMRDNTGLFKSAGYEIAKSRF